MLNYVEIAFTQQGNCSCRVHRDYEVSNSKALVVMQYTGLKDKNGKEIYEGDLVTNQSRNNKQPHPVIFKQGKFIAFYQNLAYDFAPEIDIEQIEIIGNIYENPELVGNHLGTEK